MTKIMTILILLLALAIVSNPAFATDDMVRSPNQESSTDTTYDEEAGIDPSEPNPYDTASEDPSLPSGDEEIYD